MSPVGFTSANGFGLLVSIISVPTRSPAVPGKYSIVVAPFTTVVLDIA